MICPTCKIETDGVNHNNRGLRCTACWALLPVPTEKVQILTSDDHFNDTVLPIEPPIQQVVDEPKLEVEAKPEAKSKPKTTRRRGRPSKKVVA